MEMKICKGCGGQVDSSAKVCPKCGKDRTHPVLRAFLIVFLIIGMISVVTSRNTETNPSETSTNTTYSIVTKENYNKIEKGMTEEQVKAILGEPVSTSENETPGVGTMILKHYQEALTFKAIDIYFLNGKVYMKNWTDL